MKPPESPRFTASGVWRGCVEIAPVAAFVIPFGIAFAKGLTLRMGQTSVQRHMRPLLDRIQRGDANGVR